MRGNQPTFDYPAMGERLRRLRLVLGEDLVALAKRLGVEAGTLAAAEEGRWPGESMPLLITLAEKVGVSLDWLIEGRLNGTFRNDIRPVTPYGEVFRPRLRVV